MRRTVASLALVLVAGTMSAPIATASPSSPFVGSWVGTDPAPPDGDGSTLHLSISGGESAHITFTDLRGNICVVNGAPTDVFTSRLSGNRTGDEMHAAFVVARCGFLEFDWLVGAHTVYQYDAATDTITDGYATFHRR